MPTGPVLALQWSYVLFTGQEVTFIENTNEMALQPCGYEGRGLDHVNRKHVKQAGIIQGGNYLGTILSINSDYITTVPT